MLIYWTFPLPPPPWCRYAPMNSGRSVCLLMHPLVITDPLFLESVHSFFSEILHEHNSSEFKKFTETDFGKKSDMA